MAPLRQLLLRVWRLLFAWRHQSPSSGSWAELSFEDVDFEALKSSLQIHERALENGARNLPETTRHDLDPVEQEIGETFETLKKRDLERYLIQHKIRRRQIADFSLNTFAARAEGILNDANAHYALLRSQKLDQLFRAKQDYQETVAELQEFRTVHNLRRPAEYSDSKTLLWGLLLVILLLEGYLNGTFLAKGNEQGLLGGVSYALIFAGINITLGWSNGRWFVTRWRHRRVAVRLFAVVASLVFAAGSIIFNLLVAHYREAAALGPTVTHRDIVRDFIESPFTVTDIQSLMLLFGGIIFAVVAAGDGYRWDDPYPGYGRRDRRVREREFHYADLKGATLEDLERTRERATGEFDELLGEVDYQRNTQNHYKQLCDAEVRQFQIHVDYLQQCCNRLIGEYRALNKRARSAAPPAYFDRPWSFYNSRPPVPDSDLETAENSLERSLKVISEAREAINRTHRDTLAQFKQLEDLTAQ